MTDMSNMGDGQPQERLLDMSCQIRHPLCQIRHPLVICKVVRHPLAPWKKAMEGLRRFEKVLTLFETEFDEIWELPMFTVPSLMAIPPP
jgi:hypothetical protein